MAMTDLQRKEICDVLDTITLLVDGFVESLKDDKFEWADGLNFIQFAKSIPALIDGFNTIPDSFKDFDETDKEFFSNYVAEKFDLPDDEIEEYVELLIDCALYLIVVFKRSLDLFGKKD